MEACQFLGANETGHDLFDIGIGGVMAQVHKAFCLGTQLRGCHEIAAPIGNHRRIEGRLVEFVFEENQPVLWQLVVNCRERAHVVIESGIEIGLTGEICAVGNPHG